MRRIYQVHKQDLYWHLKPEQKQRIVNQAMAVLNDPRASNRDKGIATKNLIAINQQNIELVQGNEPSNNHISVTIKHDDDDPKRIQEHND